MPKNVKARREDVRREEMEVENSASPKRWRKGLEFIHVIEADHLLVDVKSRDVTPVSVACSLASLS